MYTLNFCAVILAQDLFFREKLSLSLPINIILNKMLLFFLPLKTSGLKWLFPRVARPECYSIRPILFVGFSCVPDEISFVRSPDWWFRRRPSVVWSCQCVRIALRCCLELGRCFGRRKGRSNLVWGLGARTPDARRFSERICTYPQSLICPFLPGQFRFRGRLRLRSRPFRR